MISLTSYNANPDGAFIFDDLPHTALKSGERRLSRRRTLDGSAVITDMGFSHADRTFSIKAQVSEADETALFKLFQTESSWHLSSKEGYFSGSVQSVSFEHGSMTMVFFVSSKI